jgi:hypothetical protein
MRAMAWLSVHDRFRVLIDRNAYLDATLINVFLGLPYDNVLAEFLTFLNNCCESKALLNVIATEAVVRSLIHVGHLAQSKDAIEQVAHLTQKFTASEILLPVLREDNSSEAIFSLVRKGSPEAQEWTIQAIYNIATDAAIKKKIVKRTVSGGKGSQSPSSSLLDFLRDIACGQGASTAQSHAAWLIASLYARGDGRETMLDRDSLNSLCALLTASSPAVVRQATWGVSQLPVNDEDVMRRLMAIETPKHLCATLKSMSSKMSPAEIGVIAQGCLTIGTLAQSPLIRKKLVELNVISLLASILISSVHSPDFSIDILVGAAVAVRELALDIALARKLVGEGVFPGLVASLSNNSKAVRASAIAALVALLNSREDIPALLEVPHAIRDILAILDRTAVDSRVPVDLILQARQEPDMFFMLAQGIRLLAADDDAKKQFLVHKGYKTLMKLVTKETGEGGEARFHDPEVEEEVPNIFNVKLTLYMFINMFVNFLIYIERRLYCVLLKGHLF